VPVYLVALAFTDGNRPASGLVAVIISVNPIIYFWHLSSGGWVRSLAFIFTTLGLWVGHTLFTDSISNNKSKLLLSGAVLFGLTALTHLKYSLFFAVSYLLFYLFLDRSIGGLKNGAIVATGGFLISSPWWLVTVSNHGIELYILTASTHHGLFNIEAISRFFRIDLGLYSIFIFHFLIIIGSIIFAFQRKYLRPIWLLATAVFLSYPRLVTFVGTLIAAPFLVESLQNARDEVECVKYELSPSIGNIISVVMTILVVSFTVLSVIQGVGYMYGGKPGTALHSDVTSADESAMSWVMTSTPQSANFVVFGGILDWFPYFTDRTVLVTPIGTEWLGQETRIAHRETFVKMRNCPDVQCFSESMSAIPGVPDYVYLPPGFDNPSLKSSFNSSDQFDIRYAKENVLIYEITRDSRSWNQSGDHIHLDESTSTGGL
jgi:hypothetical protein